MKNANTTQQFKTTAGRKKIKYKQPKNTMGYITPVMGYFPRNGLVGNIDPHSDM